MKGNNVLKFELKEFNLNDNLEMKTNSKIKAVVIKKGNKRSKLRLKSGASVDMSNEYVLAQFQKDRAYV